VSSVAARRQLATRLRQLAGEGVDLLVLRARRVTRLRQQRALQLADASGDLLPQVADRGAELLAAGPGAAGELVAQLAQGALRPLRRGRARKPDDEREHRRQDDDEDHDRGEGRGRGHGIDRHQGPSVLSR
jgi:hypothetical protein